MKTRLKKAITWNLILAALSFLSVAWMMLGINVTGAQTTLTAQRLASFRYFTVDSNVLMGVIALICAIAESRQMKYPSNVMAPWVYVLKLMGTVSVTLTMLVTCFFLAPTWGPYWLSLFMESNFFMHLANPLVAIFIFLRYEGSRRIRFSGTWLGILPMVIYAGYYVGNAFLHMEGMTIPRAYDWYGFLVLGAQSVVLVLPVIFLVTWLISLVLWSLNRRKKELNMIY